MIPLLLSVQLLQGYYIFGLQRGSLVFIVLHCFGILVCFLKSVLAFFSSFVCRRHETHSSLRLVGRCHDGLSKSVADDDFGVANGATVIVHDPQQQ